MWREKLSDLKDYAPLPMRVALGCGLMYHGGIKLFADGGHANIVFLVNQLGVPFPELTGWVVGIAEFGGGMGILLGLLFSVATAVNALNVAGLLVMGALTGGIPAPLPGGDPLPAFREAFLILAASVGLFMSGAGRYSMDELFAKPKTALKGAQGSPS
jgi:putative oxidoreductase